MKNSETVPINDLPSPASNVYRFGEFVLDVRRRALSRADSRVFLTPKAFDVLLFLVQNPNRLVTKEELLQGGWGDTFVEEGNLTQYISHLRKALGDAEDARLIVTIARKGYQFTGNVVAIADLEDISKGTTGAPENESSHADTLPVLEHEAKQQVPKAQKLRWRAAVVGASGVIVVLVAYSSWRSFRAVTSPKSGKIMLAVLPFQNLTGDVDKGPSLCST